MIANDVFFDKVYGCLCGLALGDSMGMPTEFMTPEEIRRHFGYVDRLVPPTDDHIHNDLKFGMITDDTELALQIITEILRFGTFNLDVAVAAITNWAKQKDVFHKSYLGPSSARAIEELLAGTSPRQAGKYGATIGAAMRAPALGLINPGDIPKAIDDAEIMSIPTHNTNLAIAGATAMAAAIATAMLEDSTMEKILEAAIDGAKEGERRGNLLMGPSLHKRIELALLLVEKTADLAECAQILYDYIGAGLQTYEIVPVVMALFSKAQPDNTMKIIETGINMGGDTDTIGAMVGALAGAYYGSGNLNFEIVAEIERINTINLKEVAAKLTRYILERNNVGLKCMPN